MSETTILVVDDEIPFAEAVAMRLGHDGHRASVAGTLGEARAQLAEAAPDLVLLDMRLPDGTGLDLLSEISGISVVAVTAFGDLDNAVEAMKRGAVDYLRKPLDLDELALVVDRVLESRELRRRLDYSAEREAHTGDAAALLGESPAMRAARHEIETIAAVDNDGDAPNLLLLGETGTGKSVAARLVHDLSPRASRPFVRIDCIGLQHLDADRELFGGDGAPGLLKAAEDGSLFLDEVCELSAELQAKLLTVLENREIRQTEVPLRARIIAASNRNIEAEARAGRFRADLYYRLDVLHIRLPALRDCSGDAAKLAEHFIADTAKRYGREAPALSKGAATLLERYDWPGNARELAHVIERAVLLDRSGKLEPSALPLTQNAATAPAEPLSSLADTERSALEQALAEAGGNVSAAARALGITRMTMRYRMSKHGL
ncbi:MAG: sigma-54 dependent transcriptional regulator [Alphaproteobacteria bacterium]|jgi:DNA-binding NtrC family response regulator|nr:sigma-54 dependent transcriptional regulator [Alphaproteobacteria bacterium]